MKNCQKKEELDDNETKEFNELSIKLITVRDGKLGEWIGYAPLFRSGKEGDELNLEKGRYYNLADKGLGQMEAIMLDFQWNSMRTSQGWWLGYADDLLFAAMDVGGGYKSASVE